MNELCKKIRSEILSISHESGHGHIPTSFSIVEMLCAVYQTMRHDPKRPDMPDRDLFVLSKGHASLGFYCVLAPGTAISISRTSTLSGRSIRNSAAIPTG